MNETTAPGPGAQGSEAATVQRPAEPPSLDFDVAKLTDVGRARPHNEDYLDYYIPPDARQRARKGAIYLVADGMGGHQAGEVASRGVVELTIGQYYGDTTHDVGTSLVRAFRLANQQIHEQAQSDPAKGGMGSTLVAAVILGRKVYVANVGDSRAYLIHDKGMTQITEDHSWVEEQVRAKLLTPEQARRHPQRNLVTRALGSKPDVQVDLFEGELNAGDILLLCTDGLTGRAEDHEIAAIVQQYPPQEAARQLVALANERGGNDNISVLIVKAQREAVTVQAPVPVAAKKKPAGKPRSFLFPALAGVVVVLVLALGVLVGRPAILHILGTKTPTTTATVTTSPATPSATATPRTELTQTVGVTPPVSLTATLMPTETVAVTPSAMITLAVTVTPSMTAGPAATDTPSATPTSSPSPTKMLTPSQATATATSTSTPEPLVERNTPILLEPTPDAQLHGSVPFKWDHQGALFGKDVFHVLIWWEGDAVHRDVVDAGQAHEWTINVAGLAAVNANGSGRYYWTVVVFNTRAGRSVSQEADPWPFAYVAP
jgi:serine/threonine protein phosphatase PrpC